VHAAAEDRFVPGQIITGQVDGLREVATGDLDGDGDLDLLTASDEDGKIAWYENTDGQGTFGEQRIIVEWGWGCETVVAVDLDGDGDRDVLYSMSVQDKIAWIENTDGAGTFGAERIVAMDEDDTSDLLSSDLDGDGDMDVVACSWSQDDIRWYENLDGFGDFGAGQVITTLVDKVTSICAGDLDGDGDDDLLATLQDLDAIAWFENVDGLGNYGPPRLVTSATDHPRSGVVADLDGDGDLDVMASSFNDFDIAWYENTDGAGTFGPKRVVATFGIYPLGTQAADLDGDGDMDVLAALAYGDATAWFENTDGAGTFGPQQTITTEVDFPFQVLAADLDGDGDLDTLSASSSDDRLAWYENADGLGNFGSQHRLTDEARPAYSVFAADLDGDGDEDALSASHDDDKVAWYENTDGEGTFGTQRIISTDVNGATTVFAADLNGDEAQDVVAVAEVDFTVLWFENVDGAGTFGPARLVGAPLDPIAAIGSDLDGDKDTDVVVAWDWKGMGSSGGICWYENVDGLGTFGPQQTITGAAREARSIHAADVDGDGDQDVLSASFDDGKVAWYENLNGQGTFGTQRIISSLTGPRSVSAGDVDGDGDVDVLSGHQSYDRIAWYENLDGAATFGPPQVISQGVSIPHALAASDLDDDGDLDVLTASHLDDRVIWFENLDGAATFAPEQIVTQATNGPRSLFPVDLDADGRLDVLVASEYWDQVRWIENRTDQASATFRNAGSNPASYTTSLPIIGTTVSGAVDLGGTTGHTAAWLVGYADPLTLPLGGGQVLLVDPLHEWGELLGLSLELGPVASFAFDIPHFPILVGWWFSAQAIHFGGVTPFALSNAQDFVIGW